MAPGGTMTVKVPAATTLPLALTTRFEYTPASAAMTLVMNSVAVVAPAKWVLLAMLVPPRFHWNEVGGALPVGATARFVVTPAVMVLAPGPAMTSMIEG